MPRLPPCRGQASPRAGSTPLVLLLALAIAVPALVTLAADEAEAARAVSRPVLPKSILGSTAVWAENVEAFFIFGGRSGPEYQTSIFKYDPETEEVSEMTSKLPAGRQSMAGAYAAGYVFLFGGAELVEVYDPVKQVNQRVPKSVTDILRFDPTKDTIAKVDDMPYSAWGQSASYNGETIHVFGGISFGYPNLFERRADILAFDPAVQRGTLLDLKLPYPIQDASVGRVGTSVYLMGGLATVNADGTTRPEISRNIMVFHTKRLDVEIAPYVLPHQVQFAMAGSGDGVIYLMGGRAVNGSAFSSILAIRPLDKAVTTHPVSLPGERYAAGYAQRGPTGDVYLFGGRDAVAYKDGLHDIIQFTPGATEPAAPATLDASVGERDVTLTWTAPRYDGGGPISEYRVSRVFQGFEHVAAATRELSWRDEDVEAGARLTYRVRAVNSFGPSIQFAEATVVTPTRPPGPVAKFDAYPANERVILRWLAPDDTGGLPLTRYVVTRTDPDGATYSLSVSAAASEFEDRGVASAGLANGETYTYSIVAQNERGDGAPLGPVTAVPALVPDAPANLRARVDGIVYLSWNESLPYADSYVVYRGASERDLEILADDVTDSSYVDASVARGNRYLYAIVARNDLGDSPPTRPVAASLPDRPSAPQHLKAIAGARSVRLEWAPPAYLGGHESVSYQVVRTEGATTRTFDAGPDTTFFDERVTPGVAYRYRVIAVGSEGDLRGAESEGIDVLTVNKPPVARLSTSVLRLEVGKGAVFDGSDSVDSDGHVVAWRFRFADGTPDEWVTTPRVTHAFAEPGAYRVELDVKDDAGAVSGRASTVDVVVGSVPIQAETPDDEDVTNDPSKSGTTKPRGETEENKAPGPGALAIPLALALAVVAARMRRRED